MKTEQCPECSQNLELDKVEDVFTVCMKCKRCNKTFKLTYDEKQFPSNINQFNWGAFFWGGWWGFWNGASGYASLCWLLGLLSQIPIVGIFFGIVSFLLGIYYGIKGNRISWSKKEWASIETFEQSQRSWKIAAWVVFLLFLVIYVIILLSN